MGVDRGVAGGQGVDAGQVHDGHHAGVLEVHRALVFAAANGGNTLEQAQRRLVLEGVAGHVGQEKGVAAGGVQHVAPQVVEQVRLAVDGTQVKKDAGQHQRRRIGHAGPLVEILGPAPLRLAPLIGHGHHLAGAIDVATGVQTVANEAGQCLEVGAVLCLVVGVVEHHAVVLVGLGRLFAARLRTSRHPHVVHRRRPELGLAQLQQADRDGVGDGGDDVTGAVGAGFGTGQAALQPGHLAAGRLQAFDGGLLVDVAGQVDRRGAVLLGQVGGGDHAHDAGAVEHRHVVDVVPRHQQQGIEGRVADIDGHRCQGGDVGHRPVGVEAGGDHAVAQVAVGHHAEQVFLLDDQHRRHALLAHQPRRLADAGLWRHGDRRALDQRAHRRGHQVERRIGLAAARGGRGGQAGATETVGEVGRRAEQFAEHGRFQAGHAHVGLRDRRLDVQPLTQLQAEQFVRRQPDHGLSPAIQQLHLAFEQPVQLPGQ